MRRTSTFAVLLALTIGGAALAAAQNPPPARPQVPRTPHRTLGKEDCLSCHAIGANEHVVDVPATHTNRPNPMCVRCHRPAETMPPSSQHAFDTAHQQCATCHVAGNTVGAKPTPGTHTGRHGTTCSMCHQPTAQGS
jgi:predicted CXXCH cytochrome family protein